MEQTDAVFSGGDIAIHYHPHIAHWLHLESNFSLLTTNNNLPFIPQNRLNNIVKVDFKNKKGINSLTAQYVHFFAQNNVANNLLNTRYIDHLSRLKTYEIPNPGRNIYVKLSLTI